jgi:hypothetical protein
MTCSLEDSTPSPTRAASGSVSRRGITLNVRLEAVRPSPDLMGAAVRGLALSPETPNQFACRG